MPINDLKDETSVFTKKDLPRPGRIVFWKICTKCVCRQYNIQTGVSPCHNSRFFICANQRKEKRLAALIFKKLYMHNGSFAVCQI